MYNDQYLVSTLLSKQQMDFLLDLTIRLDRSESEVLRGLVEGARQEAEKRIQAIMKDEIKS